MTYCHVSRQISDHLDMEHALEMAEEYHEQIIADRKEDLLVKLSEMTVEQAADYLVEEYDFNLPEYLEEHMNDDGNIEYFIFRRDSYYKKAMLNVLDELDYTGDIEHQQQIDEERALGI